MNLSEAKGTYREANKLLSPPCGNNVDNTP